MPPRWRTKGSDSQRIGWEHYIECIQRHSVNTTAWEDEFVESCDTRLKTGRDLTDRQVEILERIYAERTS